LDNMWLTASIWIALALVASLISIRLGLTVALMEIIVGVIAGNFLGLHSTPWTDVLGSFGIVLLSFLAGAEIDPESLRRNLKATLTIGISSFFIPFAGTFLFAHYIANWELQASIIAGLAMSTTSVAIVYTIILENGLITTNQGKIILGATLVTDIITMLALGLFTINVGIWLAIFAGVFILMFVALPWMMPWLGEKLSGRFGHPYIKIIILAVFVLSWLFTQAGGQAVLPAFLVGMIMAGTLAKLKVEIGRIQIITFTILIPFYFLKAGSLLSLNDMITGFIWVLIFLALKMALKFAGILPSARIFRWPLKDGINASLLMSTGLTFGTISALYGLTSNMINQSQYTILLSAVIGSALLPALITQLIYPKRALSNNGDTGSPPYDHQ
jgi:Kef-type K+ transport system membrane component KefB